MINLVFSKYWCWSAIYQFQPGSELGEIECQLYLYFGKIKLFFKNYGRPSPLLQ